MNLLNFFLLLFAHYLLGWGIIRAAGFKHVTASLQFTFLSIMIGIACYCLLPVILEMLSVPINKNSLSSIILLVSVVPAFFWVKTLKQENFRTAIKAYTAKIRLYDLIFLSVFAYFMFASVYKCAYYPPTPRDLTSGAEAIAEYTIKEQHINNSYFTVDLSSTDNYQKPPFLLGLQIIYKALVHPFGQVWLIYLSLSFFLYFYLLARRMAHPVLAGIFTLLLVNIPEFYAYTIMPLFDFPNTVYLFIGFYFLYRYLQCAERKYVLLSSVGFGLATLARPETLLLVGMLCCCYYAFQMIRNKKIFVSQAMLACFILLALPILIDVFTMEIFVKKFLPASLDIQGKFNPNLANFTPLFDRWNLLIKVLMFSQHAPGKAAAQSGILYGETFNLMVLFILLEIGAIIITRKVNFDAACWFVFMVLVFTLLGLIGYLLLWTEFTNAKRGLFKLFPLVFVFGLNTRAVQYLSKKMIVWEGIGIA